MDEHLESHLYQCSPAKRSLLVSSPKSHLFFPTKSNRTAGSSEADDTVKLPASSPEIESLIDKWRTFNQVEIRAQTGFEFHKEIFDLQELLLRRAFEMESREREMKRQQLATSIPTPSSSNNIPSTPFSTQGSSTEGVLVSLSQNMSPDTKRMFPRALQASPISVRSSSHASSSSGQMPTSGAAIPTPAAVQEPSNHVYQRIGGDDTSKAASPLPAAQCSERPHERQLHRLTKLSAQINSPQTYYDTDPRFGSPVAPIQNPNQEDIAQLRQMASDLCSRLGMSFPCVLPVVPPQAKTLAPFNEDLNQSMPPPPRQSRETDRGSEQGLRTHPSNQLQVFQGPNTQSLDTNLFESIPQERSFALGMQQLQHSIAAAPQDAPQNYYLTGYADHSVSPNQAFPQQTTNEHNQGIFKSQPEVSALTGQQFQMQPPQQLVADNRDLDTILGLGLGLGDPGRYFDGNFSQPDAQDSNNGGEGSGFMSPGGQGEGGELY